MGSKPVDLVYYTKDGKRVVVGSANAVTDLEGRIVVGAEVKPGYGHLFNSGATAYSIDNEEETVSDNVYYSISFPSIPRQMAENIREAAEDIIGDENISFGVSFGPAISVDDPTPIGDEAADAVDPNTPSQPISTDATLGDTVAPDAEPTQTQVVQGDPEVVTDAPEGPTT